MKKLITSSLLFLTSILLISACSGAAAAGQQIPPITSDQAAALYNPGNNSVYGNPKGDVTVVEFFDYQCPYCRKAAPIIDELVKQDPNVRVVFKEYLIFGPMSEPSARAALAAQKQGKYLEMHNALMTAQPPLDKPAVMQIAKDLNLNMEKFAADMASDTVSNQIDANTQLGTLLNIDAAPAFIVAPTSIATNPQSEGQNKQMMHIGSISLSDLQQLVSQVRK